MLRNHRVEFLNKLLFLYMPCVSLAFGAIFYYMFRVVGTDDITIGIMPTLILYVTGSLLWMEQICKSVPAIERDRPTIEQNVNYKKDLTLRLWAYNTDFEAQIASLPGSPMQRAELFKGLYNDNQFGVRFTNSRWARNGADWDRLFTDTEFAHMRDAMINAGYAIWRNKDDHKDGVDLTMRGKKVIRTFVIAIEAGQDMVSPTKNNDYKIPYRR